ncbi:hypothetical protein SY88_18330 [Clostridiales bacterium PH28_bin88]|nr:hypothetical protein SY88_18330 [Clostridiales bacterium PH28_bin88]
MLRDLQLFESPEHCNVLPTGFIEAVTFAGGTPVLLSPQAANAAEYLPLLDGLLLSGGADVTPSLYGQAPHTKTTGCIPERDGFEVELARAVLAKDIPVLGICRGAQVLNVALGGTLIQDIPECVPGAISHLQDALDHEPSHDVSLVASGLLAEVLASAEIPVNSFHHQAVDKPGEGLRVVARSRDGVIEAVEGTRWRWVVGVQWHPEYMFLSNEKQARLFKAFIAAATR